MANRVTREAQAVLEEKAEREEMAGESFNRL